MGTIVSPCGVAALVRVRPVRVGDARAANVYLPRGRRVRPAVRGRPVQADPIKTMLKAPRSYALETRT